MKTTGVFLTALMLNMDSDLIEIRSKVCAATYNEQPAAQ